MSSLWFLPALGALSLVLTAVLRRYALACSLMDIPNARSSHSLPTPRGGGIAIVVSFLLGLLLLLRSDALTLLVFWSLSGAGTVAALIGFLDDHRHVAAHWRLLAHFAAAGFAVALLGGAPRLIMFGAEFDLGVLGYALAAVFLVWLLNLYNFMDGIDGIASVEAICVCLGGATIYVLAGECSLAVAPILLALAVGGFLYWNFPPAQIFMGDAGSGFLGIVLGIFSLQAGWVRSDLFWAWLILLGVFVVDATWTLLRRLLRGDRVYEAHRGHAYQHAARVFGAHRPVTLGVLAINVLWLLPIAVAVGKRALDPLLGLALAYGPLLALAIYFRAGLPEEVRHG